MRNLGKEFISKLKELGFSDIEVRKYVEEEDGKKYKIRTIQGVKEFMGHHIVVHIDEVDGKVETIEFKVRELPLAVFYAEKNRVDELVETYEKVKEYIAKTIRKKEKFSKIIEELKKMGFEVHETRSHMEAYYHVSAVDYVRLVLNYEERHEDGVLFVQISLKNDDIVKLTKKAVELVKRESLNV